MSVCVSVCVCLCVSVWPPCVAASLRRLPPNFIHALKIFPGRFIFIYSYIHMFRQDCKKVLATLIKSRSCRKGKTVCNKGKLD